LEKVEERFALGEINRAIYEKVASKFEGEIERMEAALSKNGFDSSNLEKVVEKGLAMAQNLSKIWASGGFDGKQKLQALAFPEGVTFDKKTGAVRTERVNTLFE
jgi:site-specific DNA recombinase